MRRKDFGSRLRELREEKDVSMRSLARHMGWSSAYMADIEHSRRKPPSPEKINNMASFLEVDAKELLELAESEARKVEIRLDRDRPHRTKIAVALARSWEELSDEDLEEVNAILMKGGRKS